MPKKTQNSAKHAKTNTFVGFSTVVQSNSASALFLRYFLRRLLSLFTISGVIFQNAFAAVY